jgi:glycosyltransferase involved in cell wall biosynthesis
LIAVNSPPRARTAVITRTKSRPLLLARAIASVLGQTDGDFLHVIVNDGGDPQELQRVLEPHRDRYAGRLLVIDNAESLGMEAASNVGIRASDSDLVVIHDDDDSWQPGFLARTTSYIAEHGHLASMRGCVTGATEVTEQILESRVVESARQLMSFDARDLTLWRMCAGNFFPPICFIYSRDALATVGLYREDLPVQGDWEFNLRFMKRFDLGFVDEPLANYHVRNVRSQSGGLYGNSIGMPENHKLYKRLLCNEFMRLDVDAGRFGLGYMVHVNPILLRVDRMSLRLLAAWETIRYPGRLFRGGRP